MGICLPGTRVGVLQTISQWADGEGQQCIFWLSGMAGTGKSTIAKTIAGSYSQQGRLAASFFFSQGGGDAGNARKFVTTLAKQLADRVPLARPHIRRAIENNSTILSQTLMDQWSRLILKPLEELNVTDPYQPYVMIIDALDECEDERDIDIILHILAEVRLLMKVRLRALITSRPAVPIRHVFYKTSETEHRNFILHNIEAVIVDHDIFICLDYELSRIREKRICHTTWPDKLDIFKLTKKSCGLFIWAATTCRFVDAGEEFAEERLVEILQGSVSDATPEQHLDQLYLTVLQGSIRTTLREQEKVKLRLVQKQVLGSLVVSLAPHSATSLGRLIDLSQRKVEQTLGKLHAIVDVPKDVAALLRPHHPSFSDFLLDKERCSDLDFWVDETQAHRTLAEECLQLMSKRLGQNICGIGAPGTPVANIDTSRITQVLPLEVKYACLYWIQHLQKSNASLDDNDQVHQFLRLHLLHWLEALAWLGKASEGILEIISLAAYIKVSDFQVLLVNLD